jgi:hypothetical protein
MVSLNQIFSWFKTGLIPTEIQFRQTWESFWHKSEKIPQSQIFGLESSLNNKADRLMVENMSAGLIYRAPVATVADLATTYPNAQPGWAVKVAGDGYIYQYDGTQWNNTGLNGFPDEFLNTWINEW